MATVREKARAVPETWRNRIVGYGEEPVADIVKNPSNWRTHPAQQQESLSGVLDEVGWVQNVIINRTTGHLVDGHLRVLLAERHGEQTVPVTFVELSGDEELLILASLDPIAALATIATDKLGELLRSIETDNPRVREMLASLAERSGLEIESLLRQAPEDPGPQLDRADELRDKWGTECGQLWVIPSLAVPGKAHRLLCGDSTSAEDVARLMAGERAALMPTDPPYLVDYDGGNHPQSYKKTGGKRAEGESTKHWDSYHDHESSVGFYRDFLAVALAEALTDRPFVYQWFGMMRMDVVLEAWRANGLLPHQVIIWHKSRPVLARCDFMWDYEPCMYGWVQGQRPEAEARPPANARAVWDIDQREGMEEGAGNDHPTMKPVEVIRRPIEWHTRPGDLIYEPFSGSGTALVAGEQLARLVYGLELEPRYVAAILERLSGLGLAPHLEV